MRQPSGRSAPPSAPASARRSRRAAGRPAGGGAGRSAWSAPPGSPILAPSAAATRLSSISRFSKPCASAGAARRAAAKGEREASENWHHDVTPDIWSSLATAVPSRGSVRARWRWSGPRPAAPPSAIAIAIVGLGEAAFAQRPADRGGAGRGELEAVEPAAILAGAAAQDAHRTARRGARPPRAAPRGPRASAAPRPA